MGLRLFPTSSVWSISTNLLSRLQSEPYSLSFGNQEINHVHKSSNKDVAQSSTFCAFRDTHSFSHPDISGVGAYLTIKVVPILISSVFLLSQWYRGQ